MLVLGDYLQLRPVGSKCGDAAELRAKVVVKLASELRRVQAPQHVLLEGLLDGLATWN
jgi:hypothetical protein